MKKHYCPCCGYNTLEGESTGCFGICLICFWEDDPIQRKEPHYQGGANRTSLIQAQKNFEEFGACDKEMIVNVRPPDPNDARNPNWRIN